MPYNQISSPTILIDVSNATFLHESRRKVSEIVLVVISSVPATVHHRTGHYISCFNTKSINIEDVS